MKLCLIFLFLANSIALAQEIKFDSNLDRKKAKSFIMKKTRLKNPFDLRDPFKKPYIRGEGKAKTGIQSILKNGVYTNEPTMGSQTNMSDLKVVGILVGKQRRAIVETDGQKIIVNEGDIVGSEKAELKAILPGGIVIVEKIVNVYGQDEFLETVIPLSK